MILDTKLIPEAFELRGGVPHWKERPEHHFPNPKARDFFNKRLAGKAVRHTYVRFCQATLKVSDIVSYLEGARPAVKVYPRVHAHKSHEFNKCQYIGELTHKCIRYRTKYYESPAEAYDELLRIIDKLDIIEVVDL
jgi:hypothetical protein